MLNQQSHMLRVIKASFSCLSWRSASGRSSSHLICCCISSCLGLTVPLESPSSLGLLLLMLFIHSFIHFTRSFSCVGANCKPHAFLSLSHWISISQCEAIIVTPDNPAHVCVHACRLRIMMKMHGLGDGAYWIIQYSWFLFIYCCYILILLIVGSAINLKFFRLTNYGLQIIFFFVWGNCLIACAFLASVFFTNAKTANVVAFLWVFGTGLLNNLLMENYYQDHHSWVYVVELIPSFALYRALYEQVRGSTHTHTSILGQSVNSNDEFMCGCRSAAV